MPVDSHDLIKELQAAESPEDLAALAKQFGVDEATLLRAKGLILQERSHAKPPLRGKPPFLLEWWERERSRPFLFVAATSLLIPLMVVGLVLVRVPSAILTWGFFVLPPVLHAAVVAHSMRLGPLALGGATMAVIFEAGFLHRPFAGLFYLFIYATIAMLWLGACKYFEVWRNRQRANQRSRQDLLERAIEIRRILKGREKVEVEPSPAVRLLAPLGRKPLLLLLTLSVVLSFVLPTAWSQAVRVVQDPVFLSQVWIVCQLAAAAGFFLAGFFNRRLSTTLIASTSAVALYDVLQWTRTSAGRPLELPWAFIMWALALSSAGHYWGRVFDDRRLAELRRNEDRGALLEELVVIEMRIAPETHLAVIMAVDVVGSTRLKFQRDAREVEWTFRAYQHWLKETCREFGGSVASTAGDGTILTFKTAQSAVDAGLAVQNKLAAFNTQVNRYMDDFDLRIGIHAGEMVGQASEVQFSRVIDVAAHAEARCPSGGVVLTDGVADLIDQSTLTQCGEVDGHALYLIRS